MITSDTSLFIQVCRQIYASLDARLYEQIGRPLVSNLFRGIYTQIGRQLHGPLVGQLVKESVER